MKMDELFADKKKRFDRMVQIKSNKAPKPALFCPECRSEIKEEKLIKYLGQPIFTQDEIIKATKPGMAVGLAWTSMGGDVLAIEADKAKNNQMTIEDILLLLDSKGKPVNCNDDEFSIIFTIGSTYPSAPDENKISSELDSFTLTGDFYKKIIIRNDIPYNYYDENGFYHCN